MVEQEQKGKLEGKRAIEERNRNDFSLKSGLYVRSALRSLYFSLVALAPKPLKFEPGRAIPGLSEAAAEAAKLLQPHQKPCCTRF